MTNGNKSLFSPSFFFDFTSLYIYILWSFTFSISESGQKEKREKKL